VDHAGPDDPGRLKAVIRFREFRNTDPPALAKLWNLGISGTAMARPLRVHELDGHAFGTIAFDPDGLIVAERDGTIVGFVHAGFGPEDSRAPEEAPPGRLGRGLGTIAMLIVAPDRSDPEVERGLIHRAEAYLRERGAKVIYLGGQAPLNPYYWGLYGGSEFAGILSGHHQLHRIARDCGYEPVSTTIILEANLDQPPPRDPRAIILKRQFQVEFEEDDLPKSWWESLALGDFHPTRVRLVGKLGGEEIGHARTWDMSWFSRLDGRARIGIIDFEVAPQHRRNGFGRFLMTEILRAAREQLFAVAQVQASSTNAAALALYGSTGFIPVDEATLYRLPAERMGRGL
jgi:ribosomal protein S18 acetylase RimI-like enzyme